MLKKLAIFCALIFVIAVAQVGHAQALHGHSSPGTTFGMNSLFLTGIGIIALMTGAYILRNQFRY
jgi:hypothetical protein